MAKCVYAMRLTTRSRDLMVYAFAMASSEAIFSRSRFIEPTGGAVSDRPIYQTQLPNLTRVGSVLPLPPLRCEPSGCPEYRIDRK